MPQRHISTGRRHTLAVVLSLAAGLALSGCATGTIGQASTATPSATIQTTSPDPSPAGTTAGPHISLATNGFTAPSWGTSGLTAALDGFAADTTYPVTVSSHYPGEKSPPAVFFEVETTPVTVTTDSSGRATLTWVPDDFPRAFTNSGESGTLIDSFIKVTTPDDQEILSAPLQLALRPVREVTVTASASCVAQSEISGNGSGVGVALTGLVPKEEGFVVVPSVDADGVMVGGFVAVGQYRADEAGAASVSLKNGSSDYLVPLSSVIAPERYEIQWSRNFRDPVTDGGSSGIPLQVGGCSQ
ncbi:hypothetical protein [Subtercola frigoramans]|uniref:Uncharacterized protein n=1 Tax=Subtercola frigoramans TaxID=120298 RepID=A0ABS2L3S3_9MICO|nr:hypothetical protein [Subtercola frigoramans]MBM7471106.1 hypothetical protein [Subtercola frigoramans]